MASRTLSRTVIRMPPKQPTAQQKILTEMQKAQDEAKSANERRYQEILGLYQQRQGDVMGHIDQMGVQAQSDIGMAGRQAYGTGVQDLVSRGLTGTSNLQNLGRAVAGDTSSQYQRLAAQLGGLKAQTLSGLTGQGGTLGFMERREDAYPNTQLMSQLLAQLGRGTGLTSSQNKSKGNNWDESKSFMYRLPQLLMRPRT